MLLKFSGVPEVAMPRAELWLRVIDPQFVARSSPAVETVEVLDPTHFTVVSAFGVGDIKLRFSLDVELTEVVPPTTLAFRAGERAPGSAVHVRAMLNLEELGSGMTRLNWSADTELSGVLASVGTQLMEGLARRLTEKFWLNFLRHAEAGGRSSELPGAFA